MWFSSSQTFRDLVSVFIHRERHFVAFLDRTHLRRTLFIHATLLRLHSHAFPRSTFLEVVGMVAPSNVRLCNDVFMWFPFG